MTITEHPAYARTAYPINELLRRRWSARSFAATPVAPVTLGSLFEAARHAPPSCPGATGGAWRAVRLCVRSLPVVHRR